MVTAIAISKRRRTWAHVSEGAGEPASEIGRDERCITGCHQQIRRARVAQACQDARQRSRKIGTGIGEDLATQGLVDVGVAICADEQGTGLSAHFVQDMLGQRYAAKTLQAFIDPAHPGSAATGQKQTGNLFGRDHDARRSATDVRHFDARGRGLFAPVRFAGAAQFGVPIGARTPSARDGGRQLGIARAAA